MAKLREINDTIEYQLADQVTRGTIDELKAIVDGPKPGIVEIGRWTDLQDAVEKVENAELPLSDNDKEDLQEAIEAVLDV